MSRKKTSAINKNLFANNISILAKHYGGKKAFSVEIGIAYDTIRRWCLGEFLPESNQLLIIHEITDISIDWLLMGASPYVVHRVTDDMPPYNEPTEQRCKFCGDMSDEVKDLCRKVKNIMESGHPSAVPALLSNITAFEDSVKQAERIRKLEEKMRHYDKLLDPPRAAGTGRAAGIGTRKKKT